VAPALSDPAQPFRRSPPAVAGDSGRNEAAAVKSLHQATAYPEAAMGMQVHHVAQFDRDVAEEVTKWLKYLKGQVTSVQFLTTTVPDPKAEDKWRVQYEAYITYQQ